MHTDTADPAIDLTVYPMPMFANLVVRDLAAAEAVYAAAGFVVLATIPGPDGATVLIHLRRERYQDLLVTVGEPSTGSMTVSFASTEPALAVAAERLRAAGADVEGPFDTPWFTSDVRFTDPDGNTIVLTARREADAAEQAAWARTFGGDFVVPDEAG